MWPAVNQHRLLAIGVGGASVLGGAIGMSAVAISPLVPIGAFLGLGGFATIFRAPLSGVLLFVITACLLPFAVIPVRIGVALTVIDVALSLVLVVWVLRIMRGRKGLVTTPIDGWLGMLIGFALVSFVLGSGYAAIAGEQFRLFLKLLNSMLFFYGVTQVVETKGNLLKVLRVLLVAGGLAATIAIVLYALPRELGVRALSALRPLGYPIGEQVIRVIAGTSTVRATGTSIDPNVLGGLLMLVGVLGSASLLAGKPLLRRPLLTAIMLAVVAGVVLSYSRSSWIGFAAGVGFIAGFKDRRAWWLIGIAIGAVLVLPQGQVLLDRFTSGVEVKDQAAAMRLGEYKDALTLISQYPFLGVGFGEAPTIELYVAVSSIYLLIAEEMGLVGLTIFIASVGLALVHSFRGKGNEASELAVAVTGLQGALIAALVAGLFDHYFFNIRFPHMVGLFWLLVGLLVVATRFSKAEAKQAGVEQRV
ncbi:MAG: hypothetical protein EXR58_02970 [Chloroflexi bacterium]|nr:hypothetical protein [Chloroflexota bacterium]